MHLNKLLVVASALFLLAACETAPGADGSGNGGGAGGYGADGGPVVPGTQSDLEANVGDRIFFDYDSSVVRADAQRTLEAQAEWLRKYPNLNATIEGHCDERGTREYNLALGERRANATRNYLVSLGIAGSRLTTISYGKERPAVVGSDESSWAQNRRAVLVVNQ